MLRLINPRVQGTVPFKNQNQNSLLVKRQIDNPFDSDIKIVNKIKLLTLI